GGKAPRYVVSESDPRSDYEVVDIVRRRSWKLLGTSAEGYELHANFNPPSVGLRPRIERENGQTQQHKKRRFQLAGVLSSLSVHSLGSDSKAAPRADSVAGAL